MVDSATKRWIKSKADELAVAKGCRFSERHAEHAASFFPKFLKHSKGKFAGQPFELLKWQREGIIYPLFGWLNADGFRRYRRAGVWISKKNGKSTLAAGIALYMLCGDCEAGAEVYTAAVDKQQAKIVHGEGVNMVHASPVLSAQLKVNEATSTIAYPRTNSKFVPITITAGSRSKEGLNAHAIILDELHAWGPGEGKALWHCLRYAGAGRDQPLQFVISTAGDDVQSVGYRQYDYAKRVHDGIDIDLSFFAFIREADRQKDDFDDPAVWEKANPSFGVTINRDAFASDHAAAKATPSEWAQFLRYRLGIWGGAINPWLRQEDWDNCRDEFTENDLLGRRCYGGLDLSKCSDMTALALIFPGPPYRMLVYFWLPADTINHKDSPPEYRQWVEQGWLREMPGPVCDYAILEADFAELAKKFRIKDLRFDEWHADETTQRMEVDTAVERVAFRQNMTNFANPTDEFERLVLSQGIQHNGNPILTWQAHHVQVQTDAAGNKRPCKPQDEDHRKIDGIVGGVMGLAGAIAGEGEYVDEATIAF